MEHPVAVVLVVDGDARDRALAAAMLKHWGYGVVAAHDAFEAWGDLSRALRRHLAGVDRSSCSLREGATASAAR
jgi:CheY-like chemotaxis protein